MPTVLVLYFARAREATGGLTEETFDAANTEDLKAALAAKHPALGSVLETAVLAVNQEYATEVSPGSRPFAVGFACPKMWVLTGFFAAFCCQSLSSLQFPKHVVVP